MMQFCSVEISFLGGRQDRWESGRRASRRRWVLYTTTRQVQWKRNKALDESKG